MLRMCLTNETECICVNCTKKHETMKLGGQPCCVGHNTKCPAEECTEFEEDKHDNSHRPWKH